MSTDKTQKEINEIFNPPKKAIPKPPEHTKEELAELFKLYKKDNWGYSGRNEKVQLGNKVVKIRRFPSGTTYLVGSKGSLVKLTDEFFEEAKREIEENEKNTTTKI